MKEAPGRPIGLGVVNSEIIPPQNNVMEYLVTRDELVSIVQFNGFEYEFKTNEHGHKICHVPNKGSRTLMKESGSFREYVPPEDIQEEDSDDAFRKEWFKMPMAKFVDYVNANLERFENVPDDVLAQAIKKWDKAVQGETPWPGLQHWVVPELKEEHED